METRSLVHNRAAHILLRDAYIGCIATCLLTALTACCTAQIALPNPSIIGASWGTASNLWATVHPSVYPKQIAIDYTPAGTVYGLVCKYAITTNTFLTLRSAVEKELNAAPRLDQTNLLVWRLDERKFTLMLSFDEHEEVVNLIMTSIDKRVRKER